MFKALQMHAKIFIFAVLPFVCEWFYECLTLGQEEEPMGINLFQA